MSASRSAATLTYAFLASGGASSIRSRPIPSFIADLEGVPTALTIYPGKVCCFEPIHYRVQTCASNERISSDSDTDPGRLLHDSENSAGDSTMPSTYEGLPCRGRRRLRRLLFRITPARHLRFGIEPRPCTSRDLAKAKELFREAGVWYEGFEVSRHHRGGQPLRPHGARMSTPSRVDPELPVNVTCRWPRLLFRRCSCLRFRCHMRLWYQECRPGADPDTFFPGLRSPGRAVGVRCMDTRNGLQDCPTGSPELIERWCWWNWITDRPGRNLRLVDPLLSSTIPCGLFGRRKA